MLFGISCFALAIGLMVGASNSPVVGVAITSVFGLFVALFGLFNKNSDKEQIEVNPLVIADTGKLFFLFSVTLAAGIYLGVEYRNYKPVEEKQFIWDSQLKPPSTAYEALDWIALRESLVKLGYSHNQIRDLYRIRLNENVDTTMVGLLTEGYNKSYPYSKLFEDKPMEIKAGRGPASNP